MTRNKMDVLELAGEIIDGRRIKREEEYIMVCKLG